MKNKKWYEYLSFYELTVVTKNTMAFSLKKYLVIEFCYCI